MKIITISGNARHGKDFFAKLLSNKIKEKGKTCIVAHYADFLKMILKNYYGVDCTVKNEYVRKQLQYIGTDVFRKNNENCWVNMMKEFILGLGNTVDYLIIADARFPNEITEIRNLVGESNLTTIKIFRINFKSDLTQEQKNHESETALNRWEFDYLVINDSVENLSNQADMIIRRI